MARINLIKIRGGTAAAWTSANPILADRELGYETDTRYSKIGDGVTAWNSLPYATVSKEYVDDKVGNGVNPGVTNVAPSQQAVITYVADEIAAAALGIVTSWKAPVLVATTANIALSGEQTIDGVLTSGSRVLVKNQSSASENGIYITAAGAWSRSSDADSASELEGASVTVQQGTTNGNTTWVQTTDGITLGSSNIAWSQLGTSVPDADPTTKGITKLFNSVNTGTPRTDGAIAEAALLTFILPKLYQSVTADYASLAAMIADQANQVAGRWYETTDTEAVFEYLGTTAGTIADYFLRIAPRKSRTITGAAALTQIDDGRIVYLNSASPFNLTLDQLKVDTRISLVNKGAGAVTIVNGSGVTAVGTLVIAGANAQNYPTAFIDYETATAPRVITGGSPKYVALTASNETSALTVGTSKVSKRLPFSMVVTEVRAELKTAQASGSIFTVDINVNGSTILSTKITIDNTETTSVTAAIPAVISAPNIASNDIVSVDITQVGDGTAVGLKVDLIGY